MIDRDKFDRRPDVYPDREEREDKSYTDVGRNRETDSNEPPTDDDDD